MRVFFPERSRAAAAIVLLVNHFESPLPRCSFHSEAGDPQVGMSALLVDGYVVRDVIRADGTVCRPEALDPVLRCISTSAGTFCWLLSHEPRGLFEIIIRPFYRPRQAPAELPRWLDQPVNSPVRLDSGGSTYEPAVTGRRRVCDIEILTDSTPRCCLRATIL